MSQLGRRVWPEFDGTRASLAVPVGSTEQHGPHLPLSTDTEIACALADGLATRVSGVVVAPPLAYGASGEHQAFPGTLSIGETAVELVLVELVRAASETFPRIVLVSAHGGNARAVARATRRLRAEGRDVHAWSPAAVWSGDAHAGRVETSVMLALSPAHVRLDDAVPGNVTPLRELMPMLVATGVRGVSDNGILGDPDGASAREGREFLHNAIDALAGVVADWPESDPRWL